MYFLYVDDFYMFKHIFQQEFICIDIYMLINMYYSCLQIHIHISMFMYIVTAALV